MWYLQPNRKSCKKKTEITMPEWKHPQDYGGFSPDGDYVMYARHRDSSLLENSNFEYLKKHLMKLLENKDFGEAPPKRDLYSLYDIPEEWIYDWSAGCWAYGWREYLMVRRDAPTELLESAQKIWDDLQDNYPVFDEDDYSRRQTEAICNYWEGMSVGERVYYCQEAGISMFAARNGCIPTEVYDYLSDSGEFA